MCLKVLIVDDDEIVTTIHKIYLKKSGLSFNPLSFTNGKDVLDYLLMNQDNDTEFLVFLDINMPIMSGWEFLDEINNQSLNRVHVVLVTSSVNIIDQKKGLTYKNVIKFIQKPINLEDCIRVKSFPAISYCFRTNLTQ